MKLLDMLVLGLPSCLGNVTTTLESKLLIDSLADCLHARYVRERKRERGIEKERERHGEKEVYRERERKEREKKQRKTIYIYIYT